MRDAIINYSKHLIIVLHDPVAQTYVRTKINTHVLTHTHLKVSQISALVTDK